MNAHKRDISVILLGDLFAMGIALWVAIAIRTLTLPTFAFYGVHLAAFGSLFLISLVVFYVSGLYEPHTLVLRGKVPSILFQASLVNALFGLGYFYFFPYVGIAPKTTLVLYLVFAFGFLVAWRLYGGMALGVRRKESAIFIGGGEDMHSLIHAVNSASFYGIEFVKSYNLDTIHDLRVADEIAPLMKRTQINTMVIDLGHPNIAPLLPELQAYQFQGVNFIDQSKVYEDIFDKVSLSLIGYAWVLEHASSRVHFGYDLMKRIMDFVLALVLFLVSLAFYPFVILAIYIEDRKSPFLFQDRIGEKNAIFTIVKFRSMHVADRGKWVTENDPRITRVGKFIRMTRIDELPQLWNVLVGDLSLIGPRPELPDLVKYYNAVIPYYNVRHLVKPGLSGWAQVHHDKPPHSVEETKEKLAYDLYYIKNRNFLLDLKIALKTVKTLLSRTGV